MFAIFAAKKRDTVISFRSMLMKYAYKTLFFLCIFKIEVVSTWNDYSQCPSVLQIEQILLHLPIGEISPM